MSRIPDNIVKLTAYRTYIILQDRRDGWVQSMEEVHSVRSAASMCKALNMEDGADQEPHYVVELRPTGRIVKVEAD